MNVYPMTATVTRGSGRSCYHLQDASLDASKYTPSSVTVTLLRPRHRNDETTSTTLHLEQRGGRRLGGAPMLSKQETQLVGGMVGGGRSAVRRRLEVGVGRPATPGWLVFLVAFEITFVLGVYMFWWPML